MRASLNLLKATLDKWNKDNAPRLAAALAYYTLFSVAPLLVIIIAISGLVFGETATQGGVLTQLRSTLGEEAASLIQSMVVGARTSSGGLLASGIAAITMLFGAASVFTEFKGALNIIWGVQQEPTQGLMSLLRRHALSLLMVMTFGGLLLVSLVLTSALSAAASLLGDQFPLSPFVAYATDFALTVVTVTLLFAVMYKVLPDTPMGWHPVLLGAFVTGLLFAIGKIVIALYLSFSGPASSYGASGAVVVILLWVYFSAQIIFFGAEFTAVYSERYGKRVTTSGRGAPLRPGASVAR